MFWFVFYLPWGRERSLCFAFLVFGCWFLVGGSEALLRVFGGNCCALWRAVGRGGLGIWIFHMYGKFT